MQDISNQHFLLSCRRCIALDDLHSLPRGNILHICSAATGLDVTALLDELCHGLQGFLEDQVILEADLAMGLLYLPQASAAQALICLNIHICISCKNVIANVAFHCQLEQQLADTVSEYTECSLQHGTEDSWQIVFRMPGMEISAIEKDCFFNEFTHAFTVVLPE